MHVVPSGPFREEISTVDAAEKYHLTPSYVARLARTKTVRARKFGRDWIIDEADLRAYLAQPRKTGPKPKSSKPEENDTTAIDASSDEDSTGGDV